MENTSDFLAKLDEENPDDNTAAQLKPYIRFDWNKLKSIDKEKLGAHPVKIISVLQAGFERSLFGAPLKADIMIKNPTLNINTFAEVTSSHWEFNVLGQPRAVCCASAVPRGSASLRHLPYGGPLTRLGCLASGPCFYMKEWRPFSTREVVAVPHSKFAGEC